MTPHRHAPRPRLPICRAESDRPAGSDGTIATVRALRRATPGASALLCLLAACAPAVDTVDDGTRDASRGHYHADMAMPAAVVDAGAPAPLVGALAITGPLTLDRSDVALGGTVAATMTYKNVGSAPVTVNAAVIAGRPPGGTHAGGPYDDLAPAAAPTVIQPGATLTIAASRTFSSSDPTGTWETYGTWQDGTGAWHDGPSLSFTVDAAAGMQGATPPMAPGGYYVSGNTVYDAGGKPHLFHGVDRPTLEYGATGWMLSLADYQLMASWHSRIVRIALNQDFWLASAAMYSPGYAATVDQQIAWAHQAGMDVILDLHVSDKGDLSTTTIGQQLMADQNSLEFWKEVAARYKGDGRVLFELYNEPHDITWEIWQNGGTTSEGWQAVGMQQLYDAVRAQGAENLVLLGGNSWSSDLSGVPTHRIVGHNIVYATHPYDWPGEQPSDWMNLFGNLAATDPVIVTEFGDSPQTSPACSSTYYSELIAFADAHAVSWTAWAWFPGQNLCTYPSMISDWSGTPTPMGAVVKGALLGYP